MTNPIQVVRPDTLELGPLSASMGSLMKMLAWEVGEKYDKVLSQEPHPLGPGWLDRLGQFRNQRPSLHDFSFVVGEAEHYPGSVVWQALPQRSRLLVDQLRRVRVTRNKWEHETVKQSPKTFKEGVLRVGELADSLQESRVLDACDNLLKRFEELRSGIEHETQQKPAPEAVAQLDQMRQKAEADAAEARQALAQLMHQLDKKGAAGEALARELEAQRRDLEQAQNRARDLQEQLQLALLEVRVSSPEPANNLRPGDDWQGPLPTRIWHLKKRIVDLVDPETRTLLSADLGPVVRDSARRWLRIMPQGGQVHITEAGNAAGRVAGRYVYLGRLDDPLLSAEGMTRDEISGSLMYELTADMDLLDYESGNLVSERIGQKAKHIGKRLSKHLEPGEAFRMSPSGRAFAVRSGQLLDLGNVAPDGLG